MFSFFPECFDEIVFGIVQESFFIGSFKVFVEVDDLDDWLFEKLIGLLFLDLS